MAWIGASKVRGRAKRVAIAIGSIGVATAVAANVAAQSIDGADVVSDVQKGYAVAQPCDKQLGADFSDYRACMEAQAKKLPGRARVQRQAFYFYGWLKAEAAEAASLDAGAMRSQYSEQLAKERGKSALPLKLMCRVARADCNGIEQRLNVR